MLNANRDSDAIKHTLDTIGRNKNENLIRNSIKYETDYKKIIYKVFKLFTICRRNK